jgi:predicted transcriptional regulator
MEPLGMNIGVNRKHLGFLECFSSETRVAMIELLSESSLNIKELAAKLSLSSAIVTKHIQKLEEAGIVKCDSVAGIRGMQKICSLALDEATLQFRPKPAVPDNRITTEIPVGQYVSFSVKPTCGLASETKLIGITDDPRYFAHPSHVEANHLWFGSGYVEYQVPNFLLGNQKPRSLEVSLEVCSEAPDFKENWPSDISFFINDILIGVWTSPGDFGLEKGVFSPSWFTYGSKYGLLKTLLVNESGSYIDGMQISEVTIHELSIRFGSEIMFRLASLETSRNCGGINLFGRNSGNYNQGIIVTMTHS